MKPRLPLTVISGYLGAGKTTLINRLLAEDHGLRLMIMVNDFGAINIDAALIESADDDTLTLSNGCVCCTMGADLFMAVGDILDRDPRPDHLIIEASGIADPARIANVADAETELMRAGIVTLVDAQAYPALSSDAQIGPQLAQQVAAADLICISKTPEPTPDLALKLAVQSGGEVINLAQVDQITPLIVGLGQTPQAAVGLNHPSYVSWSSDAPVQMTRAALQAKLDQRPKGVFRFKGFVGHDQSSAWEVQCVGPTARIKLLKKPQQTQVVGIGLASNVTQAEIAAWWEA